MSNYQDLIDKSKRKEGKNIYKIPGNITVIDVYAKSPGYVWLDLGLPQPNYFEYINENLSRFIWIVKGRIRNKKQSW